jgi:hypothetical protein
MGISRLGELPPVERFEFLRLGDDLRVVELSEVGQQLPAEPKSG